MMVFYEDEIVNEVYRHRAELLDEYGGIEGLHKHMKDDLPRLIAQGWKVMTREEILARKQTQAAV